jgi:hypothetical protein
MAKRYQHLTAQVRHDVAERVGGLLWQLPTTDAKLPDEHSAEPPEPDN